MSENNVVEITQFCKKHAAHLIHVSDRTIQRWLNSGRIKGYRVGIMRTWYISLPEINRMRELHAQDSLTDREAIHEINNHY